VAEYKHIVPFILQWEGGLSKAKSDRASANPVPDNSGNHTNKGVTWNTWQKFAGYLGYRSLTDSIKGFYKMSPENWGVIFKTGYWDVIKGDEIRSQGLADSLADWAWLSGANTAIRKLQEFLKIPVTMRMDAKTLDTVNNLVNPSTFLASFSDYKKKWFTSLPNQSANYKGWANRQDALKKIIVGGSLLGLLLIVIAGFFILRNN